VKDALRSLGEEGHYLKISYFLSLIWAISSRLRSFGASAGKQLARLG